MRKIEILFAAISRILRKQGAERQCVKSPPKGGIFTPHLTQPKPVAGILRDPLGLSSILARRRRALIRRRLAATMRPDPDYRAHRLAQFSPERRERFLRNVEGLFDG